MFTGAVEYAMVGLGAVAGGEDAVVAGTALVVVDAQRAAVADLEAGVLGQPDERLGADADHDVVGVERLVGRTHRNRRAGVVEHDLLDRRAEHDAHAARLGGVLHMGGHVGVERGHHLRRLLDHRHRMPRSTKASAISRPM